MKVCIEKLDHFGRGIGRINNKMIFVPNALPTEMVEVEIQKDKKNYCEGEVKKYYQVSEKRISPVCPYFNVCGGCQLMHLSYQDQLLFKENKVKEIVKKFAAIDCIKPIVSSEDDLSYRNKITLQVQNQLGLYQSKSNEIVPITKCYLISPKMNEILKELQKKDYSQVFGKVIIKGSTLDDYLVYFDTNRTFSFPKELPFSVKIGNRGIKENILIEEKMEKFRFQISTESFFQVNTKQAIRLYKKVLEYADLKGEETVLDLYCGTGTIGLFLSASAKKVIGVEIVPEAIQNAIQNAKTNQICNCEFICADAEKFVQNMHEKIDVVIVDPPRSGLSKQTLSCLQKMNASKIIYVSCDPVTFARDVNQLKELYDVLEITPFDLFPQTYHVEVVASLRKKEK